MDDEDYRKILQKLVTGSTIIVMEFMMETKFLKSKKPYYKQTSFR